MMRQVIPWHGIAQKIQDSQNAEEALAIAGLDWEVDRLPLLMEQGKKLITVPNTYATSLNGNLLGVVSDKYKIIQNKEAFGFTDDIIKNELGVEAKFESAGMLNGGKRVWMSLKLPTEKIMDDEYDPYIMIVNNHDGKGSIRIAVTPIRVWCANAINLAIRESSRVWSATHTGDLEAKRWEAVHTIAASTEYMKALREEANLFQQRTLTDKEIRDLLNELYPHNPFAPTDTRNNNNKERRDAVYGIYSSREDLKKFRGTAWGLYNAMADYTSHVTPKHKIQNTSTFYERRLSKIIDGRNDLSRLEDLLRATA